ncbi:MAG: aspartate/glutamate racemase family protein [Synergistaceae bacterium]|jgi:allantoin racemase|nr:aspartate/glutamate racemase family protein [Synergistaceae bacterium]
MRIQVIDPVPETGENLHEFESYVRKSLRRETEIVFSCVTCGFPSIESEIQGMANGANVVKIARKAQRDGADGIFVNCFDDPGVYACREFLSIPVFGGYQPAILTALSLSERVGVLTTDRAGLSSEERKARLSGFDSRIACIKAVDMGVLSFEQQGDELLSRLCNACKDLYIAHNIGAAVLGCTAMYFIVEPLRNMLRKDNCPITVIEPLQTGVKYLEHTIEQGHTNALRVLPDDIDLGCF